MFLRNAWYVVAEKSELADGALVARDILNEPVVIYRTESGTPAVLYDRCCHRHAPLSLGEVVGERLRCNYHGLMYETSGKCVHIPGQTAIPPGAEVRAYPAVEKYDWIWAWMGDAEKADESLIPDFHWNDAPDWTAVGEHIVMKGQYQLLIDNLLDLSHLGYLHVNTIGTVDVSERATARTYRTEQGVAVERVTRDAPPPPLWEKAPKLKEHKIVDRWQTIEYRPPSTVLIETIATPPGTPDDVEKRRKFPTAMVTNFITPETDDSLHYFWRHARNYSKGEKDVSDHIFKQVQQTFVEDTEMIEGQQDNYNIDGVPHRIDIGYDSGGLEGRRLLDQMIRAEQGAQVAAE